MEKIRAFGAVGNARGYLGRPIILSQYVKNYGNEAGEVEGDCYFTDPNGQRRECVPYGGNPGSETSVVVPAGQIRFMVFQSVNTDIKGTWTAHVIMDGMFYDTDNEKVYKIPVY